MPFQKPNGHILVENRNHSSDRDQYPGAAGHHQDGMMNINYNVSEVQSNGNGGYP